MPGFASFFPILLTLITLPANALSFTEVQKLLPSDGTTAFGGPVIIEEDTALIGAQSDNTGTGSVYAFNRDSTGVWSQQQKLTASDGVALDRFGTSIALFGNSALIGAPQHNNGNGNRSGAAYVFTRDNTGTWKQKQKLVPNNNAASDNFGISVDLFGDSAIIGASQFSKSSGTGLAYIFARNSMGVWDQQQKLTASDSDVQDLFGSAVAISEGTAMVSAISNTDNGISSGSVYIFTPDSTGIWNQQQKVTPSDGADFDNFGSSVSISGDLAMIAAIFDDDKGFNSGSAYIFSRDATNLWTQQQKLVASDGNANDFFGVSASISGNTAIAGARGNDSHGADSGATYVFTQDSTGTWTQQQKLMPNDNSKGDLFGVASFISDNTIIAGASGSAYIFGPAPPLVLINSRWTMISLSNNPGASNTVEDFFNGVLDPSDYITKWVVYELDESNDRYVMLNLSSSLLQGKGYWVLQVTGEEVGFSPSGTDTPVSFDPFCSSQEGCFEIDLTPPDSGSTSRFNLVGHPFDFPVKWSEIRIVVNNLRVCTPQQAAQNNLMTDTFWNYNGNGYDNFSTTIPPGGGSFEAFHGYWVELLQSAIGEPIKLLIPKGPVSDQPSCLKTLMAPPVSEKLPHAGNSEILPWWLSWVSTAQADNTLEVGEWWVRLQAETDEAGDMVDQHNYLGWYRDADQGKDHRDVVELAPFGSPYLTIVFPQNDWGDDSGHYASDMRKRKHWRVGEEWDFIVKSDQPGRKVTLSWSGYDGLKRFWRMRLIDLESGEEVRTVRRKQLQSYTFTMYDTEHRFKWIYQSRPEQ